MNIFFIKEASNNNRIIGLDALRCLAIVLVLLGHGNEIIYIPIKAAGYFGVELFFVLSGYLIGAILIKVFENEVDLKSISNFWIRRWFRTLPNYYLFLMAKIFAILIMGSIPISSYISKYFLFLQCFDYRLTPFMGESWSLCIEEWFYLIFPIWLSLFSVLINDRRRMILFSILSFILVITLLRTGMSFFSIDRPWDDGFRTTTLLRLDSIAYGVFWAWLNRFYKNQFFKYKHVLLVIGIVGIIVSSIILGKFDHFNKILIFSLTNLSFSLLLPFFSDLKIDNYHIRYVISHISIASYSIYLIHLSFVLEILLNKVSYGPYIDYFLYLSLSVFVATIVYNLYEKRMTSIRNKFSLKETSLSQQLSSADA